MKRWILPAAILLLAVAAFVFRAQLATFGQQTLTALGHLPSAISDTLRTIRNPQSAIPNPLVASGTIEAHTLDLASPSGGRIAALYVAEGQQVAAGDLIAEMDTELLDAEIAQAKATQVVAAAQLALLQAGVREADLAVAQANVAQAEAARDSASVAWRDALALVDAANDLDVKIVQAAAAFEVAGEQTAAAQAAATAADLEQALWGRIVRSLTEGFDVPLPGPGGGTLHVDAPADKLNNARLQWNLASQRTWQAHAQANSAVAAQEVARQALADLRSQRANPQTLRSQADAAGAAYTVTQAAVETARAAVDVLKAGASQEQIEAAEALATQAEAAVQVLRARRGQAQLLAPITGTVTSVILAGGEVAAPGAAIVRLADLSEVTLTVYVPESRIGESALGGTAWVTVDSLPGQVFTGTVTHITDRAEFTPKNVQTREERANLVFAVKIVLPNPDAALKPGMPADAYYCGLGIAECGIEKIAEHPRPQDHSALRTPQSEISASGAIEATEYAAAAETGGRVVAVYATEGDEVTAGQILVELDGSELTARRSQAVAAVAAARAELARVTAPPQAARVAQAEAQVRQAEAVLTGATTALKHATDLRENPQELDAQISAARAQLKTAAAGVDAARAALSAARVLQESLPNPGSDEDRTRRAIYDQQVNAAQATLRAAQAQERGVQAVLAQLLTIREKPVGLEAAVHRGEGEVAVAQAGVGVARAVLAQVRAPTQPEAVAQTQAKVGQAEAALAQVETAIARLSVRSPAAGRITAQNVHAGEVAQPGAALFTVADLRRVKLVIYVPTSQIGQVRLGQSAEVTVDAYPERRFTGTVVHVADQAEFTPRNVQTAEERVKTVFAVEIALDNSAGLLRPGLPADAVLKP